MTTTVITDNDIYEILRENYYTLGTTGAQAIEAIWGDIAGGYFAGDLAEWGISLKRFIDLVGYLAHSLIDDGCWNVSAGSRDDR
jgi:hypothetical protein